MKKKNKQQANLYSSTMYTRANLSTFKRQEFFLKNVLWWVMFVFENYIRHNVFSVIKHQNHFFSLIRVFSHPRLSLFFSFSLLWFHKSNCYLLEYQIFFMYKDLQQYISYSSKPTCHLPNTYQIYFHFVLQTLFYYKISFFRASVFFFSL